MAPVRFSDIRLNLKRDASHLPRVKIAVLGDTPTQFLGQALRGCGYSRDLHVVVYEAPIDRIDAELLDTGSELYGFAPDYILVFEATQHLQSRFYGVPREQQSSFATMHLEHLRALTAAWTSSPIVYCNFPEIDDGVYGNYANKTPLSFAYQVRALNLGLMDLAAGERHLFIADLCSLQNTAGRNNIVSTTMYGTAGFAYALDFWPGMAERVLDILQALRGRVHKAVILDLDNTLWGGVAGDDGLENLQLGSLGIGKVFSELQAWLQQLRKRGVVLAVCSKNDEAVAKRVFEQHPDMVLRLEDIAVFVANWENKVDNIRHIQSILNLGFDSIVYLDDSAFERGMVRQAIPSLSVPELPEDPADYLEVLAGMNLFETGSVTEADETRTRQYQEEAGRRTLLKTYESEEAYLASLAMEGTARAFDRFQAPRVAQLTQRSNQFNLRTLRYTDQDVARIMGDDDYVTRCFTLADNVGHYGLVSVVVLEKQNDCLFIENWLMSCRVLKRGMEDWVLNEIVRAARNARYERLVGDYIPSGRNQLVADHYRNLGFVPEGPFWVMNTGAYVARKTCISPAPDSDGTGASRIN
jgi:FkbH-like protein